MKLLKGLDTLKLDK